ncbi:hypothetical protein [Cobetia marina]|uniref:hypothetical protein n=1 Tax=Cobetia marina TaxID=28258 RepID=UPI0025490F19|nr:hypothetical protein [Cobetia pacifica]MDI6003335.1 hypothetical protein [Cobetia pacifica]
MTTQVKLEAIAYTRDRYLEEQERFNHAESKCAKFMSLLTLIIGFLGALTSLKKDIFTSPVSLYDWTIIILMLATYLTLICAWGHSFRALKIGDWPVASRNRVNCEYIFSESEVDSLQQIFDCYMDSLEKMDEVIVEKVKNLDHAYEELFISAGLISITSTIIILGDLIK